MEVTKKVLGGFSNVSGSKQIRGTAVGGKFDSGHAVGVGKKYGATKRGGFGRHCVSRERINKSSERMSQAN